MLRSVERLTEPDRQSGDQISPDRPLVCFLCDLQQQQQQQLEGLRCDQTRRLNLGLRSGGHRFGNATLDTFGHCDVTKQSNQSNPSFEPRKPPSSVFFPTGSLTAADIDQFAVPVRNFFSDPWPVFASRDPLLLAVTHPSSDD